MELRILRQYSLSQILIKIVGRLRRLLIGLYKKLLDYIFGSYKEEEAVLIPLAPTIKVSDIPEDLRHYFSRVDHAYLEQRFNLLGSGWIKVFHGAECNGFENHRFQPKVRVVADGQGNWLRSRINRSNLPESTRIWRLIASENYQPIDWQLDFKSGFRHNSERSEDE